jgi:hypothetical protein
MFGTSNLSPQELKIVQETKKATRNVKPTSFTPKQLKAQRDAYERQRKGLPPVRDPRTDNYRDDRTPRRASAPRPQAPAPVRRAPAMQEPKVITQPKPAVRPPKIMDGDGFTRPIPRTMKQGGYVSRAKYGTVNNLKKGK